MTGIFKPIEVGTIRAGLTITAGVHGYVGPNKTAGNGRAEDAPINIFGECLPLTVR